MSATDRDDQAGQWVSGYMGRVWRPDAEKALEARISDLEGWAEKVSTELIGMQHATATAIAMLLMLQADAPPDCNPALWNHFEELGGDCEELRRQIKALKLVKSLSQTGGEA